MSAENGPAEHGPWGSRTPSPPPAQPRPPLDRGRLLLCAMFLAGIAALVVALAKAFPEAMRTQNDWNDVGYYAMLLALVSAGAFRARWGGLKRTLGHAAIWALVAGILALGYAYRQELAGAPQHLQLAFSTARPVQLGAHELVIPQDDHGGYEVIGQVNGQRVRFLIDTGASDTVLSPADARRLGVDPAGLNYVEPFETANGKGFGAPYVAQRLQVGAITLDDFPMSINRAPMSSSLLGLSFLDRLAAFEIRDRKLYLKWRDTPQA